MKGYATAYMRHYPKHAKRPRTKLARLAYDLTFAEEPSPELDKRIYDVTVKFIPGLIIGPFTSHFEDAIRLLPDRWWWHVSHLEAKVTPTSPVKGAERVLSNAGRYDDEGRPVGYSTLLAHDRDRIALALCASIVSAFAALNKLAKEPAP